MISLPSYRFRFLGEWLFLACCLVLAGGVVAWSLFEEHQAVDHREQLHLAAQAQVVEANIGRQLDALSRTLNNVIQNVPTWHKQNTVVVAGSLRLKAFADAMVGIRSFSIMDKHGVIRASSRTDLIGRGFADRPYFQTVLKQPDPSTLYVNAPFKTEQNIWLLTVARMIPGKDGHFDGLVIASLDPEEFRILLSSVNYSPDMMTGLAHGDGVHFMMMPERKHLVGTNLSQAEPLFNRYKQSGLSAMVMTGFSPALNEERMVALRTIRPAALNMDKALIVGVSRSTETLYSGWYSMVQVWGSVYAILALFSTVMLAIWQRRRQRETESAARAAAALREQNTKLAEANVQLEAQSAQLHALAFQDGLTGIANRRHFNERLQKEWRDCRRHQTHLTLLMIDIDHFKLFNDHYGHQAGDDCLKLVAKSLQERLWRAHDVVARYGGEEFVCLLPNCEPVHAKAKAEQLRMAIEALGIPHAASPVNGMVTISIGIATQVPGSNSYPEQLLSAADKALYAAKVAGRNRAVADENTNLDPQAIAD
ncbi:diguanylate cyclase [Vogesella indigofera]|uniref:diguanylate cyclase n=1 Tax=Vogesella indigofera TaxID=45465 RepID=A0A495BHV3_VOGIN|nr:diguanylate cyclase [Vogesella indigofera]RKQ60806.1 diguanylate cyclase [Vogesella indigofera]